MGHSQDILAAQRALVEDDDLRDELGLDDDEAVTACPTCESASIEYHAGTAFGGEPASAPWTCQDCGEAFEAPIERSPERESGSCRHGPAKSLVDAEPDDIRTDGGVETERPAFIKPDVEVVSCHFCDREWDPVAVEGFDLSGADEYYPAMVPVCPAHMGGCR
jgi:hypothetical protein